nr:centromere protein F-like isoform X1 [Ciona intestinalis]|eukprot:XP_009860601.1 centromere protein F-like isoform X1 [Ciona intestinalis]
MWRIGVSADDNKKNNEKRKKKEPTKKRSSHPPPERRGSFKMIAPMFDVHGHNMGGRDRKGSVIAAEHLLMRRSSRGSRQFNSSDFAAFANRDVSGGAIPLDHLTSHKSPRRASVTIRMKKVKEIQDRVNKAVDDYETTPEGESLDDQHLLKEIEDNLFEIDDDMLRINVSLLLDKFRKVAVQLGDKMHVTPTKKEESKKKELLESLQTWMDEDHFEDIDDDEAQKEITVDTSVITGYLEQVQQNVKKVEKLKDKIHTLKHHGDDTQHLERQRQNLEKQMKQDALDSKRRQSKSGKQEFHYLKNAATEIYDLLHRTRMEGMAHSHQFEEQLKKILKDVEDKDKDIDYLEHRVEQEKRLVKQWCKDYEKLQNDHSLTKDELATTRKSNRKLQTELEKHKRYAEDNLGTMAIVDHEESVKEYEQHLHAMKQKLEVVHWTLKEKETAVEEQNRKIHQLKAALRKGGSVPATTEALYKPVPEKESGKTSVAKKEIAQGTEGASSATGIIPPPTPDVRSLKDELESSKMRIRTLEKENNQLKRKKPETKTTQQKNVKNVEQNTKTTGIQTDKVEEIAVEIPEPVVYKTTAIQTYPLPSLSFMSAKERKSLYDIAQGMTQQFGTEWTEAAISLSRLQADDISELDHGLSCENDFMQMFSGSTAPRRSSIPTTTSSFKSQDDELSAAREDLVTCRVTSSIQQLAEGMLSGEDPEKLEEKNFTSINTMHNEVEDIVKKISSFVSKIQAVIGCQTGMMSEANEVIKKALPESILGKLDKIKVQNGVMSQMSLSCSEHSQEWKDMSTTEQIRCKLKLIEETLTGVVSETMNVYINEVAKQHAEYSDIHTSVNEGSKMEVKTIVNDPQVVVKDIQNKVESSVRYMAKVTRAERGIHPKGGLFGAQRQGMGEGLQDMGNGRHAGTWNTLAGHRGVRNFGLQMSEQNPFMLMGHGSTPSKVATKPTVKKYATGVQKVGTGDGGKVRMTRQPAKDLHLLRLKRTRMKSEMAKTRGLGIMVKTVKPQKDTAAIFQDRQITSTNLNMNKINPVFASNLPKVNSYPESRPTSKHTTVDKEIGGLTMFDLQNQINQQLVMPVPKQPPVQGTWIDRSKSMPVNKVSSNSFTPTMMVSHLSPVLNPFAGPHTLKHNVKLPKIS